MVWQVAEVVADERGLRQLRFDSLTTCERCLAGQGCGAGVFSRLFARRHACLRLPADAHWEPGQRVRVGLTAQAVLLMALVLYGLPLVGFFTGATACHFLLLEHAWRDPLALLAGLTLGLLGCLPARLGWASGVNPQIEALSCSEAL